MKDSIILSSCLFGSVYLMGKSLEKINQMILYDKKISRKLIIINGVIFVWSSCIFVCGLSHFKSRI